MAGWNSRDLERKVDLVLKYLARLSGDKSALGCMKWSLGSRNSLTHQAALETAIVVKYALYWQLDPVSYM